MYLSLKQAVKDMDRGQTPFTPAVTTLLQINKRLKMIKKIGGVNVERENVARIAGYFREKIVRLPFALVVENEKDRANAVTANPSIDLWR